MKHLIGYRWTYCIARASALQVCCNIRVIVMKIANDSLTSLWRSDITDDHKLQAYAFAGILSLKVWWRSSFYRRKLFRFHWCCMLLNMSRFYVNFQEIAEMFVTVGMCQEAVDAYLKASLFNVSVQLNDSSNVALRTRMCRIFASIWWNLVWKVLLFLTESLFRRTNHLDFVCI